MRVLLVVYEEVYEFYLLKWDKKFNELLFFSLIFKCMYRLYLCYVQDI